MKKTWLKSDGTFKHLKGDDLKDLDDEQKLAYKEAETVYSVSKYEELESLTEKTKEQSEELKAVQEALLKLSTEQFKAMQTQMKEMQLKLAEHKSNGEKIDLTPFKEAIKDFEGVNAFIAKLSQGEGLVMKADVNYADLTVGGQLDQVATGISDLVKKRVLLPQLFRKEKMIRVNYTYLEQTTVDRDTQGVAKCAKGFASLTKEELSVATVNYIKLKDTADLCRDYLDDYDFVEARYNTLLNDSIAFKVDSELLLGTDTNLSMKSINSVSSEFSSVNPDALIGPNIPLANFADLLLGMACQIDVLGKLNSFMANVAIVNKMDWYTKIETSKDLNGNYLDPRLSRVDGNWYVGDLLVIPHVDVPVNTCYVLDTTRGAILDRQEIALRKSEENGTNFVDEFITLMVTVKLQFLVLNNDANAFMKCSDINLGVSSIKLP
jgi:hypothetical protein